MSDKDITQKIKVLLAERHNLTHKTPPHKRDEWALFYELRNGTGFQSNLRYIDAFAINLWPSRGYHRIAYEIKASRGDWLNELKKPEKRQTGMAISNEFYFVAPQGIINLEEVPEGCGLIQMTKKQDKLRVIKHAQQTEAEPVSLDLLASFCRQACNKEQLSSLYWYYSGREMTDTDLATLLNERMDYAVQSKINEEVEKRVENIVANYKNYVDALQKELAEHGLQPIPFLDDMHALIRNPEKDYRWGEHKLKRWVLENVRSPAGVAVLERALRTLEIAEKNFEGPINALKNTIASLDKKSVE